MRFLRELLTESTQVPKGGDLFITWDGKLTTIYSVSKGYAYINNNALVRDFVPVSRIAPIEIDPVRLIKHPRAIKSLTDKEVSKKRNRVWYEQ